MKDQANHMNQKNQSSDNLQPFYNTTIPNDWKELKVKDVATIKGGYAFDSLKFRESGKYQVVKMSNVYDNILDLNRSKSFLENLSEQEKEFIIKKDDIIITLTGTIGKRDYGYSYQIKNESNLLLNQRIAKISVNSADSKYLFYEVKTNRFLNQFFLSARGGTGNQANVGTQDLATLKIILPPLPEQRAIAHVLSLMDSVINQNNQLIAQKELRKKWLMQNLLTGKKRLNLDLFDLYDTTDLKTEKEKSGKSFNPKNHSSDNWKEVSLGDVFERVTRKNTEVNTNVVTISAQRGFVRQTDFFNKSIASEIIDNYFLVEKGEFCYNKSYSNGYPWGATKRLNDFDKAVVTTLYICFGIKDLSKTSGDFFEQYFEANLLDRGLTQIAHEGGRAHGLLNVTPSDFFSLKITIPSFEEQSAIAQVLQAADKEIQLLKAKTNKLREQKKGMMQVLLTGKKRLNYDLFDFPDNPDLKTEKKKSDK